MIIGRSNLLTVRLFTGLPFPSLFKKRPIPKKASSDGLAAKKPDPKEIFLMFTDKDLLLMTSMFIYSGLSQSYIYGAYTSYMGKDLVPIVMTWFGVVEVAGMLTLKPETPKS